MLNFLKQLANKTNRNRINSAKHCKTFKVLRMPISHMQNLHRLCAYGVRARICVCYACAYVLLFVMSVLAAITYLAEGDEDAATNCRQKMQTKFRMFSQR